MPDAGRIRRAQDGPSPAPLHLLPLLKRVSRAFYLSIRVLPGDIRGPVGLAYLLARAADTISDTAAAPPERRLGHLLAFRRMVVSGGAGDDRLADLIRSVSDAQTTDAERDLLSSIPSALAALGDMEGGDRARVVSIVSRLTEGMEFDLTRFPPGGAGEVRSLDSARELDRYAYLVAGCVGEFWTHVTAAHTPALAVWDIDEMVALGVSFGKALQMTNVLRDAPQDLVAGRCYLPSEWLDELGLSPGDLLNPDNSVAARPALALGVEAALDRFAAAERYLLAIPRRCFRLRLAALWPLLIGLATLEKVVRSPNWLDPNARAKVSRRWVYSAIALSLLAVPSNRALSVWTRRLTNRVRAALDG